MNPSFLPYVNLLEKTTTAVVSLAKSASLAGVSPTPLWRAFAAYNENALKGSRCMAFPKDKLNASIELVRTKALSVALPDDIATEFAGLTLIVPGSMDDAKPQDKRFLADPRLMELWSDYAKLRFGPKERAQGFRGKSRPDGVTEFLPFEERQSMEWNESASKFLRKVEEFAKRSDSDSDPITAYQNISGLYSSLLEILPMSSNSYPTALSSFIAYISGSPTMRQNTAVWLWRVKIFLRRGSIDESEESFKRIRAAIREQGNQALNTLLDFDRFYPNRSEKNINVIVVP